MLFGDLPRLNAARCPARTAIVDGERRLTWAEVDRLANRCAHALADLGARRGARVAMLTGNRHEWALLSYGAARLGASVVPLPAHYGVAEVAHALAEAEVGLLVADAANVARLDAARDRLPSLRQRVVLGGSHPGWLAFDELLAGRSEDEPARVAEPDDELIVLYTSGSTGRPKGIVLTHRNAIAVGLSNVIGLGTRPDDVGVIFIPVSHKGGFHINKLHALVGATVVIMPRFDARGLLATIQRERVTNIIAFPSLFQDMLALPDFPRYDLSTLRRILVTGTVMTRGAFEEARRGFPGAELQHAYGLTDAGGLMTVWRDTGHSDKLGSVGRAMPNCEIQVHDHDGRPLAAGQLGEIVCRGDSIMRGYIMQPELTAQTLRGGWLHTGDLGRYDEDGDLWMVGRLTDLIKTGAESVAPLEIEDVLSRHPAVREVAVFGVPDRRWGEAVTAAVALRAGRSASERELIDFCAVHLAGFKKPKRVHFVDALPKNALSAKVLKDVLRDQVLRTESHA